MSTRPERRFLAALTALGLVGALQGVLYAHFAGPYLGDSPSYTEVAHALLHGGLSIPLPSVDVTGLRIPLPAQGALEREVLRAPGYPLFLALAGSGTTLRSAHVAIAYQAVLTGLTIVLFGFLVRRLWSERAALVTAALLALDPYTKHYVPRILSEVLAGFLVVAAAYAFVRAWQERSTGWWAATGAITAALVLTRPAYAVALPLLLVGVLVRHEPARVRLARAAALAACAAALLVPWLAWTTAVTGSPVLVGFNDGWNLLLAAHGDGPSRSAIEVQNDAAFLRDFVSVHRFAPSASQLLHDPNAHGRYLARADAEQRRLAVRLYRHRLAHEPLTVLGEAAYRAYFLWAAHSDWVQPAGWVWLLRALDVLALALAAVGVGVGLARGGALRGLAVFLVAYTLLNAIAHVEARYGIPVRSLFLLFALLGAATLYARLRGERDEQEAARPHARGREVAD